MNREKLLKMLQDISLVRIAIIGDFCLDAYWFVDETMSETSVETNLSTRPVSVQRYSLGGAGNVANNLAAIGIRDIRVFGVIGTDPFGTEMVRIMNSAGISTDNLLIQEYDWHSHTYAKPYLENKELNRFDFGNFNKLSEKTAGKLIENLINTLDSVNLIIINQQVPSGIHTGYLRQRLAEVILKFPQKMFITDSRSFNDFYNGSIRKMNDTEALRLCGINNKSDEVITWNELVSAAKKLYKRYQKPLFITKGSRGSLIADNTGIKDIPGLIIRGKVDTVGAGDSYLSGAASALAAGYGLAEAAQLGTLVAGVTVQKLFQTGTATPDEILAIGADPDYLYSPELAEDIRKAKYLKNTEIEIINNWENKPVIRHAIFDHDGTISTLREGWEQIMTPMMTKAVLGDSYSDSDESIIRQVQNRVNEFVNETTGIQTLAQMYGLIDIIKEFGFVEESKILDPTGYKHIYNEELMKIVRVRELKLKTGKIQTDDLTIRNVIPFLNILFDSGIKLYLASGTDIDDVKKEASLLGYDHLFEGRIFGSVGDVTKEAKKIVLDNILNAIGRTASDEIVTFGDGPVEIRETKKSGGLTVGVASREQIRFGLNEQKRTRLIKAGADIIIPDFSQYNHLLKLLNI